MSKRNGDRARFGRERQKKMLRRKLSRAVRQAMAAGTASPEAPITVHHETGSEPVEGA